eukprot:6203250-Pleurochrysis_carterae.AAC.3
MPVVAVHPHALWGVDIQRINRTVHKHLLAFSDFHRICQQPEARFCPICRLCPDATHCPDDPSKLRALKYRRKRESPSAFLQTAGSAVKPAPREAGRIEDGSPRRAGVHQTSRDQSDGAARIASTEGS